MGGIPGTSQWGVCYLALQILILDLISDQYLWGICKGKLPQEFSMFLNTYGDKHYKSLAIKDIKQRQRFNEDVFEASILWCFIVSFKRYHNEYLMWFFFTFRWSLNLLMSFSLPKCDCKSLCVYSYFVCVHPLNKDVSQAIIGTFFSAFYKRW